MVHFYIITSFKRAFLLIGIENFPLLDESEGFELLYVAGFVYLLFLASFFLREGVSFPPQMKGSRDTWVVTILDIQRAL